MLKHIIGKGEYINHVMHSGVKRSDFKQTEDQTFNAPINLEEGYKQIIYPVRAEFTELEENMDDIFREDIDYKYIYTPFENSKIEFSTFIKVPTRLEVYSKFTVTSKTNEKVKFNLSTCGKVVIYVNGEKQITYAPFTRNVDSTKEIELSFGEGNNEVVIYAVELAERDVFYYYQLELVSDIKLEYSINPQISTERYNEAILFLDSLYLVRDTYKTSKIEFDYDQSLNLHNDYYFSYNEGFERYYESNLDENWKLIDIANKNVDLSGDPDFMSYITFQTSVDGFVVCKRFFVSKLEKVSPKIDDLEERLEYAKNYIVDNGQTNVNKSLIILEANRKYTSEVEAGLEQVLEIVEAKGDCADFYIVPLMLIIKRHLDLVPPKMQERIKRAILDFRYWIDEPGSDVMWWFSENHALLFHIAQYIGGDLYENEVFTVTNRIGREQYNIGKKRIIEWFEIFNKYGLAEWNSTTYIPIDLIGFISLYELAPDEEIKTLAKDGLDKLFEIMAINFNGDQMASSYGRCYEKELKAMEFGELSFITWMVWGRGYVNSTSRSTALMAITKYKVPNFDNLLNSPSEGIVHQYKQGIKGVEAYLFKSPDYAVGSVLNYEPGKKGHQQHTFNISLGKTNTQLWINHPGELVPSGENRPSYWAGNGIMPRIEQYKNNTILKYNLKDQRIGFVHMYIPHWNLTKIEILDDKIILEKDDVKVVLVTNAEIEYVTSGANSYKEIKFIGSEILIGCTVDYGSKIEKLTLKENDSIKFGPDEYKLDENNLLINNKIVKREIEYLI